ncbi:oxygen-insensitive NADPH nitroreductase [Alkalihalobacillus oceani]|uniref:oxygen-insensitive NADPH nitroreductase n=1 Tax=Halalkalibacter oceani TaxID=1653776 RepID=UPI0020408CFD|nr:oxygen-insensitive NADPH nitroreductase [Halalkalibacter oceani]MCM3760595.1 oxygen-insensitive NADPH nitroreductase [Halalkalibacter oceani]
MVNNISRLIQNHRSIRKYTEEPISSSILEDILSCAQWASSSHNVQSYSIIVVRDKEVKRILSKICNSQEWVVNCQIFLVFCADFYRLKLTTEMYSTNFENDEFENFLVGTIDTALAAENVIIAAESYGVGGVFMGGIRNDIGTVNDLLNLPQLVVPLFGMCLGYPAEIPCQKPRLPKKVVIHYDSYKTEMYSELNEYERISADYYARRTNGRKVTGWTKQMAEYLSKPHIPDLKSSILKQGFPLK